MFVFNLKFNKNIFFKSIITILCIICLCLVITSIIKIINEINIKNNNLINDDTPQHSDIAILTPENYTNILKSVHDNLNTYLGQKISFSGYVYRVPNLKKEEFVLARDMDIGNNQTVVVGFLCYLEHAEEYENYTWINITGEITKGNFNGEIPCIKITSIERINKPENDTVKLPDDSFVPTSVIY